MKAFAKRIVASALSSDLAAPLLERFFASRVPIVFYHGVWPAGSEELRLFGGIDVGKFRNDLALLSRRFRFVALDEALRLNRQPAGSGKPFVCVTFDDGLSVAHCEAVLAEFGVPAAMFVTEACVDNRHLMWVHKITAIIAEKGQAAFMGAYNEAMSRGNAGPRITSMADFPFCTLPWDPSAKDGLVDDMWSLAGMPPLPDFLQRYRPYMTTGDLRGWMARGHTVGLHTLTHPFCSRLGAGDIDAEFVQPAEDLRDSLGLGPMPFAYPFGRRLSPELEREAMTRAGLTCMLGTAGLSLRGTSPAAVERAQTEFDLPHNLYFEPVTKAVRGRPVAA